MNNLKTKQEQKWCPFCPVKKRYRTSQILGSEGFTRWLGRESTVLVSTSSLSENSSNEFDYSS